MNSFDKDGKFNAEKGKKTAADLKAWRVKDRRIKAALRKKKRAAAGKAVATVPAGGLKRRGAPSSPQPRDAKVAKLMSAEALPAAAPRPAAPATPAQPTGALGKRAAAAWSGTRPAPQVSKRVRGAVAASLPAALVPASPCLPSEVPSPARSPAVLRTLAAAAAARGCAGCEGSARGVGHEGRSGQGFALAVQH